MRLDPIILRHLWPSAPQAKIMAICEVSSAVFAEHGIDNWDVVAELMGNISHENGAGTIIRESGNYSAPRIVQVFGAGKSSAKVTPEEAPLLAHNAQALFERVYNLPHSPKLARDLGNSKPGDGYKYRGGGDLQLTGRANYERIGALTGHPEIIDNPDLLADPKISFTVAVAEFAALGCIPCSIRRDTLKVRRLVNGGTNGLAQVQVWVERWRKALPQLADDDQEVPRGADTGNKTLMQSKIMKGVVSTAVPTVAGTLAKVAENANSDTVTVGVSDIADKVQKASDTITTVQMTADSATAIVHTVKPVLGLPPNMWAAIAIACAIIAIGTLVYTGWQRHAKLRDEGV